ncbi:MAG: fatty acid--CoA ligase family protein [Pseudomonadota bacterium]
MSDFLFQRLASGGDGPAVVHGDRSTSHNELLARTNAFCHQLTGRVDAGTVVSFSGDYSVDAVALFLALLRLRTVIVPLSSDSRAHFNEYREIAEVELQIEVDGEELLLEDTGREASAELYQRLRAADAPGLVLFSSGSTGKSKAIVQDLARLIEKFEKPGKAQRMLIFLQLDHIGGVNSLLYSLANAGTLVTPLSRAPDAIAAAVEKHRVELLPTSPTFLNLLLLSGSIEHHDLSSLKLVTYGTEPMQASTLERLGKALPHVRLQQTYGLSEVGILRSRSRGSDSLWMQVGGDEFETKIQNGTLWIRSRSAMLGYLNAPDPFDEEGFLDTGDLVEQDGEWIRILGRESEIINVGGQKVYPAEVESALLELENVTDAVVYGEANPITGQHVKTTVTLSSNESAGEFKARMRRALSDRLQSYKVPARVALTDEALFNERFKRMRRR